ncbi:hypothetical protein LG302_19120 [Halomonas organivorans]
MRDFIITCHGWSASNWLSYVLNQHPDLVVSHSAANLIDERFENDIRGRELEFKQGYLNRTERSIADGYAKIRKSGSAKAYGSVHLYRLRDLPVQHQRFGIDKPYNIVNLVRNPVDLVWSGYGQFQEIFRTDINELHWSVGKLLEDIEFCYEMADKHDLRLGDLETLAFFCAARVLGSLRLDLDAMKDIDDIENLKNLGILRMEDVTTSRESLIELFDRLFLGKITCDRRYLDHVYGIGEINTHKTGKKKSGRTRYINMTPWQQEVLCFYMDKYNLKKPYAQYGYSLDYL